MHHMYIVFRISSLCILFKTIKRRLPVHVRLPVVWYPAVQNVKAYGINTLTEKQNYRLELIELITVADLNSFDWNWTAWVSCSCVNLLFYVLLWSMVLPCESALMMVISWIGAWNNFASKYVCPTRNRQLATKNPSKTRISVVIFGRQIWDNESSQKHLIKLCISDRVRRVGRDLSWNEMLTWNCGWFMNTTYPLTVVHYSAALKAYYQTSK